MESLLGLRAELSAATPGSDRSRLDLAPADKHGTSASGDFGSLVSRAQNCGVLNLAQLDHGQLGGGQPPHLQQHGTEQQQQRQQQAKGGFSYFRPSCR